MPQPVAPDGGFWGYMAVFGCFMGNVIGDGVMYSFGIFMPNFKCHFGVGSAEISTVNAIQMGVTFASGPIASWMTNRLGWRLTTVIGSVIAAAGLCLSAFAPNVIFLYFSAGVLIGLGLGIIYLPRLDCITQYFDKKRPLVTGIAICGSGIGTFIFAPLTDWLLTTFSWQTALLILGGICIGNCFFALLFKPIPESYKEPEVETCQAMLPDQEKQPEREEKANDDKKETFQEMIALLRNWVFMMFAVSNFLTSLGYPIPYTFVPDNAKQLGISSQQGSSIVGIIGITNTFARLILGVLSLKMDRLFLYNTCLVVCGLSMCLTNFFQPMLAAIAGETCAGFNSALLNSTTALLNSTAAEPTLANITVDACAGLNSTSLEVDLVGVVAANSTVGAEELISWACDQYLGQLIYAVLYGVTSAAYVLLTTLVLADLLGADAFTNAFGLLLLFQGVATFIGPPVVGAMFDAYKSYNPGFLVMGLMIAASGAMLYPIPCIKRYLGGRGGRGGRGGGGGKRGTELEPL